MFDLPDISILAAIAGEPRFLAALAAAVLSGAVRGFSGFGSALVYIPLMSAAYGPQVAAASFLLIDVATGFVFLGTLWRKAVWSEILPLAAAAVFAAQFGALILQYADPTALRWAISLIVLAVVTLLASGWRYDGRPQLAVTLVVGLFAGLLGGALQMSGPPIILYWLGGGHAPAVIRANFLTYFSLFSSGVTITYAIKGFITAVVIGLALLVGPAHVLAMWAGSRLFRLASERAYRTIGYATIALAALASMPLFDRLVR